MSTVVWVQPQNSLLAFPQTGTWKGSAALQRRHKVVAPPEDTKYGTPGPCRVLQDQGPSTSFIHELSCQEQMMRMKGTRETARDGNARKRGPSSKRKLSVPRAASQAAGMSAWVPRGILALRGQTASRFGIPLYLPAMLCHPAS